MCYYARITTVIYSLLWIIIAINRSTELAFVGVASQIVFSEQIISKWSRTEWIRWRCESIYKELYRLMQGNGINEALALEKVGQYENAKATSAIVVSSKIFQKRSAENDKEWAKIRGMLKL